ncbi:hypothetical protein RF55_19054 [Lasius niger]|uniref:CCHC-type domain-containing protein n=1 Tax=Lasius niger TaxID=67767 RepID=A0A0J7MTI0_LASNI|nr:hypothetical protein RF55_19054 [Lasius niger]
MINELRAFTQRETHVSAEITEESERESEPIRSPTISTASPAQAVTLLAPQIPEFGGTDDENVQIWTQRVVRVAQVHRASDDVVLLAASSKLTKLARQWYEMQTGSVLESWTALRQALIQMFDRRVSFTVAMQRIEARKWSPAKESFDQYSMDKLSLIHRLNLPTADTVNLIIGGIPQHSLRATALTLPTHSLDQFLEAMRRITFGMGELDKRNPSQPSKNGRNKDAGHKGSDGKGQRDTKAGEGTCNYCKKKGHWKSDCLLLKKKEKTTTMTSSPTDSKSTGPSSHPTAAAVAETESHSAKFHISTPLIRIDSINGSDCELFALMDTGSPVSFIDSDNFSKIFTKDFPLEMVDRKFNALSKTPIDVIGKTKTKINFRDFPEHNFDITFHVVSSAFADFNVIIGRDFLEGHNLTLVFRPSRIDAKSFTQLLLESDVCYTNITHETIVEDCEIDFGREEKQRLKNVISECMNECTDTVIDNYSVTVHLKETSPYAYAPLHLRIARE